MKHGQVLPEDLAPKLLRRFSSSDGYVVEPNLVPALKGLRRPSASKGFDKIVIGVVTNSDDRVPSVLSSFGLNVSPLRHGAEIDYGELAVHDYDIDFHCMSYDVGVEKPDKLIFNAAELMLAQIVMARGIQSPAEAASDVALWRKLYVGDEYAKDVLGALNAGWNAVLLGPDEESAAIPRLEDSPAATIETIFSGRDAVRVESIHYLLSWLNRRI